MGDNLEGGGGVTFSLSYYNGLDKQERLQNCGVRSLISFYSPCCFMALYVIRARNLLEIKIYNILVYIKLGKRIFL